MTSAIAGMICGGIAGLYVGDVYFGALAGAVIGAILDPCWPRL